MIIPKIHRPNGIGITPEEGEEFTSLANRTLDALTKSFKINGVNFFANYGKIAGQEISHAHFHLVPRYTSEMQSPFESLKNFEFKKRPPLNIGKLGSEIKLIQTKLK